MTSLTIATLVAYAAFLYGLTVTNAEALYRVSPRLHSVRLHLIGTAYNYPVAFWRRFIIANAYLVAPELLGWRALWRLAPRALVD